MGLFSDLVDGFVSGVNGSSVNNGRGRIDRLCRELGWSVDERDGETVRLHFNAPCGGIRKISIMGGDKDVVSFLAHSFAIFPADDIAPTLLAYLLRRNLEGNGVGTWGIHLDEDDGMCSFHIIYPALGDGLNATALQYICHSLCKEAADFEGKIRQAGLLR